MKMNMKLSGVDGATNKKADKILCRLFNFKININLLRLQPHQL